MQLATKEKEQLAIEIANSTQSVNEIAARVKNDPSLLAYIAWRKAIQKKFEDSIGLVRLGAWPAPILQQYRVSAPYLIEFVKEAEFRYFCDVYLANPDAWEQNRLEQRARLEAAVDQKGIRRFSDDQIAACLVDLGFGDNIKEFCEEKGVKNVPY